MSQWVFLRGLMRDSRHWGDFPAMFSQHIAGATPLLLDLPGNGQLHRQCSPVRVEAMVESCRASLAAQGASPPYYLFALSLGAMAAVAWAQKYPTELNGCVLMNTSMRPFHPFYRRLRPGVYADLCRLILRSRDIETRETLIWHLTSSRSDPKPDTLAAWVRYQREYPVTRRNALSQLIAAIRYRAPERRPPVPMLILTSAADRLVHPLCSRLLAEQWRTAFAMHPSAGHDLPLDDGSWVAAQVRDWLAEVPH